MNMRRILKTPTLRMMEGGETPSAGAQMYGRASANLASMVDTSLGMSGVKPLASEPAGPKPMSRHDGMFSNPLAMPSMPTIGMQNGGEVSPWSLKGMYRAATGPKETVTEKYARQDAERATRQPAAQAPQASATPPQGISGYAGNAALDGRMKAAGLKDGGDLRTGMGGHVPGSGSGDKIDAKYEPGEFVVSNDMLDAAPGLREQLRDLRGGVLAAKGMTPEQADAKAVSGGGLRAQSGYSLDQIPRDRGVPVSNPVDSSELSRNLNNGLNALGGMGVMASVPLRGAQTVSGAASAGGRSMSAAPILTNGAPRLVAPAARAAPDFIAGVGEGANVVGRVTSNLPTVVSGGSRALSLADNAVNAAKTTNVALQEGAQANSMAALARTAANANAASSAGSNALKGALPAQPFTSQVPNAVAAPLAQAAAAPAVTNTRAYSLRQGTLGENDNAYHGDLTGKINAAMKSGQTDLASTGMRANDIYKTTSANGTTSYSGYGDGSGKQGNLVSGDGTELRGRGSVSSVPGMSKELIAQTLRNPDGSTWSAADNARMAANLRDGADPYAGTSRASADTGPKRGEPGYNRYQATKTARDQNATTLRGQDQQMEIAMAPSRLAAQQRKMAADIFKQAGGDNARAAGLAMSLGMDPKMYQDALAAQNTARASDQTVLEKFRENGKKEFQIFADGKLDEQASGQMFDTARRLFPKIESADEGTRNAAMADAKELTGIFQKARSQDKVGFDALKFWEPRRAELSGMPDATGGRVETLSGLGGVVTLGASNGDTTLTKDGKTVNLGRLNQRQLELLKTAQQSNWGN